MKTWLLNRQVAEYNETVLFQCSAGYERTSVVYICTASEEFVPDDDNDISSTVLQV